MFNWYDRRKSLYLIFILLFTSINYKPKRLQFITSHLSSRLTKKLQIILFALKALKNNSWSDVFVLLKTLKIIYYKNK